MNTSAHRPGWGPGERLAAIAIAAWLWLAAWRNPAEAINGLSDGQVALLQVLARTAVVVLIAALVVLWVFNQVQSAMPMPVVQP